MKTPIISGVILALLPLLGAQSGSRAHRFIPASTGCTPGPTTNLLLQMDAPAAGTITSWVSGVGGITATPHGGTISSVASVFGTSPGVRLTAANSQYFTLSSVVNGGVNINHIEVMIVWKPATITSGAGQYFTSGASSFVNGVFAYWVANSTTVQGADAQNEVQLGTGTGIFTANTIYQMNVTYDFDTSTESFRLNKAPDTIVSPTFHALEAGIGTLGASTAGTADYVDGWIGAIYIFAPNLTLTDTETWENYLSCKYPGA